MANVTNDMPRRLTGRLRHLASLAATLAAVPLLATPPARAGTLWVMSGDFGTSNCGVFRSGTSTSSIYPIDECAFRNNGLNLGTLSATPNGARAYFEADAPPGITITCAYIQHMTVQGVDPGWVAGDYWAGGGNRWSNGMGAYSSTNCADTGTGFSSGYWGFQLECFANPCQPGGSSGNTNVQVNGVQLRATENGGPSITAVGSNNLWYQSGRYVRGGGWPVSFSSTDVSGVCSMTALVDNQPISAAPVTQNFASWHQCPDQSLSATVDTRTHIPTRARCSSSLTP